MSGPVSIGTHRLQPAQPVFLQAVRQSDADTRMILMVVGSFDLDVLSVQPEAGRGIPAHGADSEIGLVTVDGCYAGANCGDQAIKIWRIDGPQFGVGNCQTLFIVRREPGL